MVGSNPTYHPSPFGTPLTYNVRKNIDFQFQLYLDKTVSRSSRTVSLRQVKASCYKVNLTAGENVTVDQLQAVGRTRIGQIKRISCYQLAVIYTVN